MESFVDACSPNPCKNGGACNRAANGGFTCYCANGYSGTTCQTGNVLWSLKTWFHVCMSCQILGGYLLTYSF